MKLKVIGRGPSPTDWTVVEAETGEIVRGVSVIDIHVDANKGLVTATLKMFGINSDIEIEGKYEPAQN